MTVTEPQITTDPATRHDPVAVLTQHVIDARNDIAALKAIVATQSHLSEMETRLNKRLDRIETKLDRALGNVS